MGSGGALEAAFPFPVRVYFRCHRRANPSARRVGWAPLSSTQAQPARGIRPAVRVGSASWREGALCFRAAADPAALAPEQLALPLRPTLGARAPEIFSWAIRTFVWVSKRRRPRARSQLAPREAHSVRLAETSESW